MIKIMGETKADFLTSESGFINGIATIVDLSGSFYEYNRSENPGSVDQKAIANDWNIVGQDLKEAYVEFETKFK